MAIASVSEYLAQFEGEALARINQTRAVVNETAPDAAESFTYGMIGWKLRGRPLVYVGGFAKHTGLYATPSGHEAFAEEFATYKRGKGSVQFPLDEPFPVELIRRVVDYRVREVQNELPFIGKPATSAFKEVGITTVSDLNGWSEKELLALHGVGPKAIRLLREAGVELD
ncbi:DUF1801 domain-containing protein [Actinomycetaceae bacterium L2_0104]